MAIKPPNKRKNAPGSQPRPPQANGAADPASTATTPGSASSRLEQEVIARAMRKLVNREELTGEERQSLARHEKEKEERLRWQYYGSIPQKHWRAMSGRQTKVLNEQAERYGLPFGGPFINLPALARALHDFLADNAVKLAKEEDELLAGGSSPALERYREERAALARMDRLEREGSLLPRNEVRESLGRIASILRQSGDSLGRQFGPAATDLVFDTLDDAQREIDRVFGTATSSAPTAEDPTCPT